MRLPGHTCRLSLLAMALVPSVTAQVDKIAMRTTGISCGICAGLSEIYFRRLPGIDRVKISLSKEAIMLTYKPGAKFDPAAIRKVLEPLKVGVVQFQIDARGRVQELSGKRTFIAGTDRFAVLDAIDSPPVAADTPIAIQAILYDSATPMEVKILDARPIQQQNVHQLPGSARTTPPPRP
jgi:hypothetical protein